MLKQAMQDAMNKQVNAELFSEYLYLGMAAYFEEEGFQGMASWMKVQAGEEHVHAMKFFSQILERGGKVKLAAIPAPPESWKSVEAVFEQVASHEAEVTAKIHAMVELAASEHDHAAAAFLQFFVTEQVEEESVANTILHQVRMVGASKGSLFMIDHRLGKRAITGAA